MAARAKRCVVVLENGTAVTMPWLSGVQAVLAAWYPGCRADRRLPIYCLATYVNLPTAAGEPPQRLIGWQKIALAAGESKTVSVTSKKNGKGVAAPIC